MNNLQLDRNEQIGVVLCSVAVIALIFLGMYIATGPKKAYERSRADLQGVVDQLGTLQALKVSEEDRVQRMSTLMETLKSREASFDLLGFVDKLMTEKGLKGTNANFENARRGREASPNMQLVSLSLSSVGMNDIVDVLHGIYASNNLIIVQSIDRMRPAESGQGMDCNLTLASLKPVPAA